MYLGEIPRYVLANVKYLSETFPNHEIVLITDSDRNASLIESLGSTHWSCPDIRTTWKKVSDFSAHKAAFRNDFWFKTVARFYALYEYQSLQPDTPLLHVEADVWLSPRFPLHLFSDLKNKVAYPLKNSSEGIASTLFLSDLQATKALIGHTEQSFVKNKHSTDVSVLGSFYKDFPNLFENLPTLPFGDSILRKQSPEDLSELLGRNLEKYRGIFDASSLGIHYTGVDPRNNWGLRTLFDSADSSMEFFDVLFTFDGEVLRLRYRESTAEIFSLHIHSKDSRFFNVKLSPRRLTDISNFDQRVIRNEFDGFNTVLIFAKTLIIGFLLKLRQGYRGLR